MIQITEHGEGAVLAVRAQPGARRNAVVGEQGGALKVAVTAPPDQGKANKALAELLAETLQVKRSQVELVSGPAQRDKKFLIRGVRPVDLQNLLQALLECRK